MEVNVFSRMTPDLALIYPWLWSLRTPGRARRLRRRASGRGRRRCPGRSRRCACWCSPGSRGRLVWCPPRSESPPTASSPGTPPAGSCTPRACTSSARSPAARRCLGLEGMPTARVLVEKHECRRVLGVRLEDQPTVQLGPVFGRDVHLFEWKLSRCKFEATSLMDTWNLRGCRSLLCPEEPSLVIWLYLGCRASCLGIDRAESAQPTRSILRKRGSWSPGWPVRTPSNLSFCLLSALFVK